MALQDPSTIIGTDIDLGNAIVYFANAPFTSFANAIASTKWRKLGIMKEGITIENPIQSLSVFSGVPLRKQVTYYVQEDLTATGQIMEVTPRALARISGGKTITETVKSSSPAATTVATGSTKTVINVASSTGYKAKDEIRVGNAGSYQYGRIKSISGNAITLYEGLDNDTNPTTGHAVAKIDTASFDLGSVAAPSEVAIKISKTLIGNYGSWDLIIPKANFLGNISMSLQDGTTGGGLDAIGVPFTIEALSDSAVESGKLAQWLFTHTN